MSNILLIGSGGCGGKLLETGLTIIDESMGLLSNNYDPTFINSNLNEMEMLPHFRIGVNGIHITGQGTGRDREVAKESMRDDSSKFYNYFASKAPNYHMAVILFSGDGGFGNGSVETISKVLKNLNPNISVLLVGAMPKYKSRKIGIENALLLHKDVRKLIESEHVLTNDVEGNQIVGRLVDSVVYINNEKMDAEKIDKELIQAMKEDEEYCRDEIKRMMDKETLFNFRTMEQVITSLDLHGGAVDISDTIKVNSAFGYRLILPLPDDINDMAEAIAKSIEDSPFVLPPELEEKEDETLIQCSHLVGVYNEDCFSKFDWQEVFDATEFEKNDYHKDMSFMVANGFNLPNSHMNMLKEALSKISSTTVNTINDAFDFEVKRDNKVKVIKQTNNSNNNRNENVQSNNTASTNNSQAGTNKNSTQSLLERRKKINNVRGLF